MNRIAPQLLALLCLCTALLLRPAWALDPDDLLTEEEAFQVSATWQTPERIHVQVKVAEHYYVYKDKFNLSSGQNSTPFGPPSYPPALRKQDPIFGNVEVYRDVVDILLPVHAYTPQQALQLNVTLQGCADLGVCYPPMHTELTLQPPAAPATQGNKLSTIDSFLGAPSASLSQQADEVLQPEQAFPVAPLTFDGQYLPIEWQVAPGYYLYKDKLSFTLRQGDGLSLGVPVLPKGEIKQDAYFGEVETYSQMLVAKLPIEGLQYATEITLDVGFQGCAEVGICYPPMQKQFEINLTPSASQAVQAPPSAPAQPPQASGFWDSVASPEAALKNEQSLLWVIALFFAAGVLVSLTPCIFPMVPIVSGLVLGQSGQASRWRGFLLSFSYVLGMALMFGVAGVAAALSGGASIQSALQTPALVFAFAGLFVLLSLAMFGVYELQLPSGLLERVQRISSRQASGSYFGAFIVGVLSSLILSPCVTPVLVQTILHIAQKGDYVYGGLALFAMGLGMGVPLMVIGASADRLLPKRGAWMETVRNLAGCLMLAAALWTASPFLSAGTVQMLIGALLIFSSVLLWPKAALSSASSQHRIWFALLLVIAVYGATLMLGSAQQMRGGEAPSAALAETNSSNTSFFINTRSKAELESALAAARAQQKVAFLDFYADWCVSCHQLEKETLSDPRVEALLRERFYPIRVDLTAYSDDNREIMRQYEVVGPPILDFIGLEGERLAERLIGFVDADTLLKTLNRVGGGPALTF